MGLLTMSKTVVPAGFDSSSRLLGLLLLQASHGDREANMRMMRAKIHGISIPSLGLGLCGNSFDDIRTFEELLSVG